MLFRLNARPWINPDAANVEEVINTIRKYPSGALSYSIDGIEHREIKMKGRQWSLFLRMGLIIGGIQLIGWDANNNSNNNNNIQLEKEHQRSIIHFIVVEHQITSHFAMVCTK
jgi:Divergent 4Fe-4S mono-cluster